jgi:hypothetical protein
MLEFNVGLEGLVNVHFFHKQPKENSQLGWREIKFMLWLRKRNWN